jgi:hypothetical protein
MDSTAARGVEKKYYPTQGLLRSHVYGILQGVDGLKLGRVEIFFLSPLAAVEAIPVPLLCFGLCFLLLATQPF